MKKTKRSSKRVVRNLKSNNRMKLIFLVGSIILIAVVLLYGALQKTFTSSKAAPFKKAVVKYNPKKGKYGLHLSCTEQFKDFAKIKKEDVKNNPNELNDARIVANTSPIKIKSYLTASNCPANYTNVGDVGITSRTRCCITNEFLNQARNLIGKASPYGNATDNRPAGMTVESCGLGYINCGSYLVDGKTTIKSPYKAACVKMGANMEEKPSSYQCAVNVGSETTCKFLHGKLGQTCYVTTDGAVATTQSTNFNVCYLYQRVGACD